MMAKQNKVVPKPKISSIAKKPKAQRASLTPSGGLNKLLSEAPLKILAKCSAP